MSSGTWSQLLSFRAHALGAHDALIRGTRQARKGRARASEVRAGKLMAIVRSLWWTNCPRARQFSASIVLFSHDETSILRSYCSVPTPHFAIFSWLAGWLNKVNEPLQKATSATFGEGRSLRGCR